MELTRLSVCLTLLVLAVSQCSEARHSMDRREVEDVNYDNILADEATDDEAQNDAEGNDVDEDVVVNASIVTASSNYSVSVGKDVRLECKISPSAARKRVVSAAIDGGNALTALHSGKILYSLYNTDGVVVQWTKNDNKYFLGTLRNNEQNLGTYGIENRFSIAANSTDLVIRDATPSDSGSYKCEVLQTDRPLITHNLAVLESPKILRFTATNNGSVKEGSMVVLQCEVSGSPPPQVVWSRDGADGNERLQEKDGEFVGNSVYIEKIKREESGKYYCYAFNGIGSSQAEVTLTVSGKPRVHIHKTIVNSAIDVEAVLQCTVHDEPSSHIRWYKDGQVIENASRQYVISTDGSSSNLTVVPTSDNDFGTFTCEAENAYGSHNRSVSLVQAPAVDALHAEGARLDWTVTSHRPLRALELQYRELGGDGSWQTAAVPVPAGEGPSRRVVYSLQAPAGRYEVLARALNDHSWSEHSDSTLVEIENVPQYIQHASVYRGNSAHSVRSIALTTTLMYLLVRTM